jgi:hypothetical protein
MKPDRGSSGTAEVDDVRYEWQVSIDDGTAMLRVAPAGTSGQRMEVRVPYRGGPKSGSIRSGIVSRLIKIALEAGWRPHELGLPTFQVPDQEHPFARE